MVNNYKKQYQKIVGVFLSLIILAAPVSFAESLYPPKTENFSVMYEKNDSSKLSSTQSGQTVVKEFTIVVDENGKATVVEPSSNSSTTSELPASQDGDSKFNEGIQEIALAADDSCSGANDLLMLDTYYYEYINPSGDVDWHKLNLESPGTFTVDLDVPSGKDYDLDLYLSCSSSRSCLSNEGSGIDEQCSVSASSGYYYAKVYGYSSSDYSSSSKYYIKGTLTTSSKPDFDALDIYTEPAASLTDEATFTLKTRVSNIGTAAATPTFRNIMYRNDAVWSSWDDSEDLLNGYTKTYFWDNQKWPAGTYSMKLVVDTTNTVAETNEGNNDVTSTIPIATLAKPDFDALDIYT